MAKPRPIEPPVGEKIARAHADELVDHVGSEAEVHAPKRHHVRMGLELATIGVLLLLFKRLIPVRMAPPSARVLAHLVGDTGGGDPDGIYAYRVPGTIDWPRESQVASGRSLHPVSVYPVSVGIG